MHPTTDLTLETISPLLDKAQSYALGLDTSEGLTVDLVAVAGSEDDTKPVANTLQALLTLGKNAVQGMRQDLRGLTAVTSEAMDWILEAPIPFWTRLVSRPREATCICRRSRLLTWPRGSSSWRRRVAAANTAARRTHERQQSQADRAWRSTTTIPRTTASRPRSSTAARTNRSPIAGESRSCRISSKNELYNQYNFEEPWDGPNNRKLLDKMPAVYGYPGPDGEPLSPNQPVLFRFHRRRDGTEPQSCCSGRRRRTPA